MNYEISVLVKAAGFGKRMNPITQGEIPKTMIEVGGIPILLRTVDNITRVGFEDIRILVRKDDTYSLRKVQDRQVVLIEPGQVRLGTAKGVDTGKKFVPQSISRSILIVTGDDSGFITPTTYNKLIDFYQETGVDCTNLVVPIKDNDNYKSYFIGDEPENLRYYRQHYAYTGILIARKAWLDWYLSKIKPDLQNGEFQLSRIFELARFTSRINMFPIKNQLEWSSFNTPEEYKQMMVNARKLI